MKLGIQVDLGPGHIVLDGDPAPLPKGAEPPIFGPYLFWQYGWMDQDASWYGDRPHPGDFVLDGDPARLLPPQKGGGAPNFRRFADPKSTPWAPPFPDAGKIGKCKTIVSICG